MKVKPFAEQGHYTEVHNTIFDHLMPRLSGSAFKVLCFVIRSTRGWGKNADDLSYHDIGAGTGIKSPTTISAALVELTTESQSMFGTPLLLKRQGEKRGASTKTPTFYALNRRFEIDLKNEVSLQKMERNFATENGVKQKTHTPKNGAKDTPENGVKKSAPYKDRAPDEESTKQISTLSGGVRTPTQEDSSRTPPPPAAGSHCDKSSTRSDLSSPIVAAVCEVCGLVPNFYGPRDRAELVSLMPSLREIGKVEGLADDEALASAVRARFAEAPEGVWDRPNPPRVSQIAREWKRMGMIAQKLASSSAKSASNEANLADRVSRMNARLGRPNPTEELENVEVDFDTATL